MKRTQSLLLVACLTLAPFAAAAAAVELPKRPGDFWPQREELPAHASMSVDPAASVRFDSLAALTEHGLRERPESRAVWLSIQAEAARLDAATADYWPTLTGSLSFTRSQALSSSGATVPTLHRYGPSLGLAWVLYDFGARAAGVDAQRFRLIARLLENDRTLLATVAEIEAAYYTARTARAAVSAQVEQEAALKASFDAVEVRLRGGLAARADLLRARAALAEATLAREAAEREVLRADAALKRAAGIDQRAELLLDWDIALPEEEASDALLADLLGEAERQRPDLLAVRAAAASARTDAARARAARWPRLALSGNAGRTYFLEDERTPSSTYSVGVTLSVPLFDGGRLAAEARAAERDADRLAAEADVTRADVARDVTDAYHDLRHAQQRRAGVTLQFDSAAESAEAAQARYRAGVGSLLELLTAQADLARARLARADADSAWLVAFSRLNHALGRLPASPAP